MKTFYQFLEAIEKHKLEKENNNSINTILEQIKDKEDLVRFALYCAEDCFHLNNDNTRNLSQNCINLVKQWLDDPESITEQQLFNISYTTARAADAAYNVVAAAYNNTANAAYSAIVAAYNTANAAYNAAHAVYNAAHAAVHGTNSAARNASNAFYYANDENESIRQQKFNEYKAYALSLLRTSKVKDKNQIINYKGKIGDKGKPTGRIIDKMDIFALLDTFQDHGEDIISKVGNELHLNFPNGMVISGKSINELVDKIWENQAVLHYLEKLYKSK